MSWDPFLIKNLLKSKVCGTREQCTGILFTAEKSKHAVGKEKKKTKKCKRESVNEDPNRYLITYYIEVFL